MYRLLLVPLAYILFLGACSDGNGTTIVSDATSSMTDSVSTGSVTVEGEIDSSLNCGDQLVREPDYCYTVDVGDAKYRYGFAPAGFLSEPGNVPAGKAVLVDPGGPGVSVLAGGGLSAIATNYLVGGLSEFDLIVIEEPWVTRDFSDQCADAMTDFYLSFRPPSLTSRAPEDVPEWRSDHARSVSENCELDTSDWGLSESSYTDILNAIELQHNTIIHGFVGSSFGSVRWAYADPQRFEFALISRPFPINVRDADTFLRVRAETIVDNTADAEPVMLSGVVPEDRSLSVESSDVVAARIAAAAQGRSPGTESEIGKWSDGLWQRYGETSISPALLAYWQELCHRIGPVSYAKGANGINGSWAGDRDDVFGYLRAFHQVCDYVSGPDTQQIYSLQNVCVVISHKDTVTPVATLERDFGAAGATVVLSEESNHASLDGLLKCVDQLSLKSTPNNNSLTTVEVEHPEILFDGEQQGWRLIDESSCASDYSTIPGYGSTWNWYVASGVGPLDSTPIVAVTEAEANSELAAMINQALANERLDTDPPSSPEQNGILLDVKAPHYRIETFPDGSVTSVEGVPAAAVQTWTTAEDADLEILDAPCWEQRWDRKTADVELSDVKVLYGDFALLRVIADRAAGAVLEADAQHSNVYTYRSGDERVAVIDLRPQSVIAFVGYHAQPLLTASDLAEIASR